MKLKADMRARPGTAVALGKCSNCGGEVEIRLSKSMLAYYFCPHADHEQRTARCNHGEKWGRPASERMIRRYEAALAARAAGQAEQVVKEQGKGKGDGEGNEIAGMDGRGRGTGEGGFLGFE